MLTGALEKTLKNLTRIEKLMLAVLLVLIAAACAALIALRPVAPKSGSSEASLGLVRQIRNSVSESGLQTARSLGSLAYTREEHTLARRALRLADEEVDLAFAIALRDAADDSHAAPNEEIRQLRELLKQAQARLAGDQQAVERLQEGLKAKAKPELQQQLEAAQLQLTLDREEVADASQKLIWSGGDAVAILKRMLDQHEASHSAPFNLPSEEPFVESWTVFSHVRAWQTLQPKQQRIEAAAREADNTAAALTRTRQELQQRVDRERSKVVSPATAGADAPAPVETVHQLQTNVADLVDYGKRVEYLQELGDVYREWLAQVAWRRANILSGLLIGVLMILLICLASFLATRVVTRLGIKITQEQKRLRTLHLVARMALRAVAILAILFVIFGAPGQTTTILGLAGAGLTVALKDFIVAFFGWFVLMGKNGIRVGDWVEINGIGGEVVEIGILRTVLLETGQWSDAGHPTGRKAAFVNSFAVEGHYFNFSTSGQWLWDQLEVLVPLGTDPYQVIKSIQQIVTQATEASTQEAEQEWQTVAGNRHGLRSFSATPALSLKTTAMGISIVIRYITRAHQRYELRGRLNAAIVDLLHKGQRLPEGPETPAATTTS